LIRLTVFLTLFVVFAALEAFAPRKARVQPRAGRWFTNLSITVLNTLALRALSVALPFLAVGAAVALGARGRLPGLVNGDGDDQKGRAGAVGWHCGLAWLHMASGCQVEAVMASHISSACRLWLKACSHGPSYLPSNPFK